ncbi:DUF4272 domain-containing protein [Motilimonas cestriensis]|uniref:DUF4272 domain-containing protein n=1 Tax=Motilimonas cestriensis TaxID=2742685 RepID=A0ABS8W779_9GAMM|nr:DUF4272 domain-containing protein [Motilimonas cestriensis]MCE2593366.1 DUF4272 domain-containing protein [Motilimonas cestriensis]
MSILLNAYCTHLMPPSLAFPHTLHGRRDLTNPELTQHLKGFQGYVMEKGNKEMTKIKYHLLRHIQRVNHHFSFTIEETDLDALAQWSLDSNAILFLKDGSIRSPVGSVLFTPSGDLPDPAVNVPFLPESYNRREQTEHFLKQNNIPVPKLPPIPCEQELLLRSEDAIYHRAMALFVVALRAEYLATGEPIQIETLKEKIPDGFRDLSPAEIVFLNGEPSEEEVIQFAWRYEGVALLLWVLGLLPELDFPNSICDVPNVAKIAFNCDALKKDIKLKPINEVLDCLDLHYRLHWLCRQAALDEKPLPFEVDSGVIVERHYALNWLIGFEGSNWDDVDTPT